MKTSYEELIAFGKGNVDALIQSGTIAAKGYEELVKAYTAYAGQSFQRATATMQALAGCKTPLEVYERQTALFRENAESALAEGRKLADMTGTVLTSAVEPLQARVLAAQGLYKPAA